MAELSFSLEDEDGGSMVINGHHPYVSKNLNV